MHMNTTSVHLSPPPPPCLLMHCVAFLSISTRLCMNPSIVLSVKRWISKSHSQCWKGFKYAEDAGKLKNVQELEDFSEEQQAVELLRTNEGLIIINYHKL